MYLFDLQYRQASCVARMILRQKVVILVFYGASAAMRDVSEAGLICIAMTACTAVVLVTPVINQVAWKTADNNTDGYSARPEQAIISAERKFQHLIVAILYGLSISLLLLIGSNQHKALNITCVVLGSMTCVSHLLYSITLFVLHT
ncbi:uncharacterized protein LOC111258902 isoform X2 [Varroa jacobsoni]|uniref:uncharacterized protein LOC111258902 isoform X2 n=1 Tax=Varroa jacobsoni TaxID=62625 RepID=UPI000BF73137|nr:uncharacterized protein LOC111258902 isoform X2 [Varroa jacobsoni]